MKKFEENLENNSQISDEFKEIARQAFSELLEMLGQEGFEKWLKIQSITKDVKTLLYEWADSEEMRREAAIR